MKIKELIESITESIAVSDATCDTYKSGNPENTLTKVAVCMHATIEVIKKAQKLGAELLIVHEPTFYDHMDKQIDDEVVNAKRKLIDETGITIFRYHDHMHAANPDMITDGVLKTLGLCGKLEKSPYFASYILNSDKEYTPLELASLIQEKIGIAHVRICGSRECRVKKIAACFGTPGGVFELLRQSDVEAVLTGEACEWMLGEYARDAAALGKSKALLIMGHEGSERDGMKKLSEKLKADTRFETVYLESGEVYTYTDSVL